MCAALNLEHANCIRTLQRAVNLIVFGQLRQIEGSTVVSRNQFQAIFNDSHHAESEQVYLDDAQVGAVFLIPLDDGAARHGRALQRHNTD